jgi:hypothetical protein
MAQSICLLTDLSTFLAEVQKLVDDFLAGPINPLATYNFETALFASQRRISRQIIEVAYNEAARRIDATSDRLHHEGEDYRRLTETSPNPHVATLFGTIRLTRHLFRACRRDSGEKSITPAEMFLGLMQGATPALAETATRCFAAMGATQNTVIERIEEMHGVAIGVGRLRKLLAERAQADTEQRIKRLADKVLKLLKKAAAQPGKNLPVLSIGRDGVTLRQYQNRNFEMASVATITVYGRDSKRVGTVYLGFVPEPLQTTLTDQLTQLIERILSGWIGEIPRLAYVTDAGENETAYFDNVLRQLRHPRTGEPLQWQRVIDFYHAMERVWMMAAVLFATDTRAGYAWARRMGKLLKKRNGPFRMLHAAAALRAKCCLTKTGRSEYARAYNYIRERTSCMQYYEYHKKGVPMGSGVTEAACKTLVSQRLKLSGMRWTKEGAQVVLDLRTTLMSGVWKDANQDILANMTLPKWRTPAKINNPLLANAA